MSAQVQDMPILVKYRRLVLEEIMMMKLLKDTNIAHFLIFDRIKLLKQNYGDCSCSF